MLSLMTSPSSSQKTQQMNHMPSHVRITQGKGATSYFPTRKDVDRYISMFEALMNNKGMLHERSNNRKDVD